MDFLVILVLALYITQALTKSRSKLSKALTSDEEGSIENLLYYKDCQRNAKPAPLPQPAPVKYAAPPTTTPPPRQPECLFPKMCCALSCGNECGGSQPAFQMQPGKPGIAPQFQSPAHNPKRRVRIDPAHLPQHKQPRIKNIRPSNIKPPPLPTRRDFSGFTKEKIKGLIAKDDDIRKILKDLVRVTIQKVDLQDKISANQNNYNDENTVRSVTSTTVTDDLYMDDYVE